MSLYTLFALINGDVIFDSFLELKELSYLISQWFLYIYLFISIAIIFNIIVVIIGDGYVAAKTFSKYDWIKTHDEDDDGEEEKRNISTFFNTNIDNGEDPLEAFRDQSKYESKRKERIKLILIKDKQLSRIKYAHSLGVSVRELKRKDAINSNDTPVQRLAKEKDILSFKVTKCIKTLNLLQKNYNKIRHNDDIEDEEKEDMKDRIRA
mmetsp:Transcript_11961/g.10565  ORF Transcript_11961/g.10565 Transcript_11961/m.10565 type:complete len:208 (+) Transcript_11961:147-770(+)